MERSPMKSATENDDTSPPEETLNLLPASVACSSTNATNENENTSPSDETLNLLTASMACSSTNAANENDDMSPSEETLDFDDDTLRAIAQVYMNKGNEEYRKQDFSNAIYFYTQGITVKCKDKELKAKLHSNRAIARFKLGKYQGSLSDARSTYELQPFFKKAIVTGARACSKLKRFREALTWCVLGLDVSLPLV